MVDEQTIEPPFPIAAGTPTPLSNFEGTLASINKNAGSLQAVADTMAEGFPKQLQKAVEA